MYLYYSGISADYNSYLSCFFDIDIGCTVDFDPDGCIDFPKRYGGLVVDV